VQKSAHEHFGFSVLTLYPAHVKAALFLCMHICHSVKFAKNQVKTPNKPFISICSFEDHSLNRYETDFYEYSRDEEGLYRFTSRGKRTIVKIVGIASTTDETIFNLWFGDLLPDDSVDDMVVSNNGDTIKVLATVIQIAREFILAHASNIKIGFTGSTSQRTVLYQNILKRHYSELSSEFIISVGIIHKGFYEERMFDEIDNAQYLAFFIKRKL
jgi:hypothetical protein